MLSKGTKPNRNIKDYVTVVRPVAAPKRKRELIERMQAEKRRREEVK
jgi:hypothetical protein